MKFEATRIHFLSDVSVAVALVVAYYNKLPLLFMIIDQRRLQKNSYTFRQSWLSIIITTKQNKHYRSKSIKTYRRAFREPAGESLFRNPEKSVGIIVAKKRKHYELYL